MLTKQSNLKSWKVMPQNACTSWSKRDDILNPRNYNFNQFLTRKIWYIFVKISKLPLDFVNRKSCCSQLYRIIISLTYTTLFDKPQYMHCFTNSTQNPVLIVMIRWDPYFSKSHMGHFRTNNGLCLDRVLHDLSLTCNLFRQSFVFNVY